MIRQSKQFTAIYCRIDNGGNADMMAETVRHQELQATEYARQNNLMPAHVFSDIGFSGNTMKRPAFQEMLRQIKAGNVSAVIVYNFSRFSRNTEDTCYLLETLFSPHCISLYSVYEGHDTLRMLDQFSSFLWKGGKR